MSEIVRASFYELGTGEFTRTIECPEDQLSIQTQAGEGMVEGDYGPRRHYFYDGQVCEYTDEQASTKASRPWWTTGWSNASMSWTDPRVLDDYKEEKWAELRAAREAMERSPFTWDGSTFDCDPSSQLRLQGGVQLASVAQSLGQPFTIDWTLADNTVRTLSATDMINVGLALAQHVSAAHAAGRIKRAEVEAATTVQEVEAITW